MGKRSLSLLVSLAVLILLGQGCASGRKYSWGKYDTELYRHYKNPQDREAHLERLREIVENAEAEDRVPPGLYAEYGYSLYELGSVAEAIPYFEKERAKWPESNVLMEKMIRNARRQQENLQSSSSIHSSPEQGEGK